MRLSDLGLRWALCAMAALLLLSIVDGVSAGWGVPLVGGLGYAIGAAIEHGVDSGFLR